MSGAEKPKRAELYPESVPYWKAAAQGKLLLRHCRACGKCHHYPRNLCPHCGSTDLDWQESAGAATVYSFTALERGAPGTTPPVVAYVTLEEGPTIIANLTDISIDSVEIGQKVRGFFRPRENSPFPALLFRPV